MESWLYITIIVSLACLCVCPGAFLIGITWLLPAYFFPLATYKKHLPAKLIPFTSKFTIALFLNLFFYYPIHAYNLQLY